MALAIKDRVKETTTTTSTGTYTLAGAVTGFETFGSVGDGNTTYYVCTDNTSFEIGIGTYTASGTTLARTTILQAKDTYNTTTDQAVDWPSGTRTIFCTYPADKAVFKDASNNINGTFVGNITGNVTGNASGTAATVTTAAQSNITSLGTLTTLTVDNVIINGTTIGHTSDTDLITLADGVVTVAGEISVTTLDIGGDNVTSSATELNLLDGVSGLVQADFTKLAAVDATADELDLLDGSAKSTSSITLADADGFIVIDGTTTKQIPASDIKTYISAGDITGVTAGVGLSGGGTSGGVTLTLDLSELSDVTPANGDKLSTLDSDGSTEQLTTVASLATLFAGTGLTASSSVIGVDASQTQITSVGTIGTGVWQGTAIASSYIAGDAITEAKIADDAVESEHLNNNVISGQTEITTGLVDADELLYSDGGTIKRVGMDTLKTYFSAVAGSSSIVTTGALNSGSITSGFGTIDTGSSAISTTGTVTYGSLSDGAITITAFVDEDDMSTDSATLVPTQQSVKAYVDANSGGGMSNFILEDGDGTEVTVADGKEVKFVEGGGIDINWTDTSTGSDGDPYDLTFTINAAQTDITSIYATDLILGEDAQTAIDFGTANEIDFKVDNAARLTLTASALYPVTNNQIDLGTSSLEFKDAFFDGTVTADAFAGPLTGDVTGNADTASAVAADNISTGDSAISLATSAGNITIDAQAGDADIIFKGTDGSSDITALTLDMSSAGNAMFNNNIVLESDSSQIKFGASKEVTLTHVHNDGLLLNSDMQLQFGDSGTYIHQSADGVLDLVSDTEIELNATTIDINGAVEVSGNLDVGGSLETATIDYTDGDNAITIADGGGTTFPQTATFTSGIQSNGTVTVGVDDTGHDVKFFGATSGKYMEWDESADQLNVSGTLSMGDSNNINIGAGNDLQVYHNGSNSVINNNTGTFYIVQSVDDADMIFQCDNGSGGQSTYITLDGSAKTVNVAVPLKTDDTTEATSTTDGSLQTDGGLSVVKDAVFGDDVMLLSDSAVLKFGADSDVTLTHAADTSLTCNLMMAATTFEPSGDTAAGDNAAIGYTSGEGLILTGQGSTSDVTIKNDADADVLSIATGTTILTVSDDVNVVGRATGTVTTDNDGNFDLQVSNQWKCTPSGDFTLTLSNPAAGQSGSIMLINSGGHTVSAHASIAINATTLTALATAGTYMLSYYCSAASGNDTILVSASGALT